jgi:hypothetical protein
MRHKRRLSGHLLYLTNICKITFKVEILSFKKYGMYYVCCKWSSIGMHVGDLGLCLLFILESPI